MGANAQTSVPLYVAAEVLTAADMNISAGTGVPVFATTVTRDAAFGGAGEKVLAEGQLAYIEASNIVQYYDGAAWATVGPLASKIAQVVTADKVDTFSTSSSSYVDVTGWTASITPSAATSKVLVFYSTTTSGNADTWVGYQILRGATAVGNGTASGITVAANKAYRDTTSNGGLSVAGMYLDSPATTSATTYKIQIKQNTTNTTVVGATYQGQNNTAAFNCTTNITLMEIVA